MTPDTLKTSLIDNWAHPLSKTPIVNGELHVNMWYLSSEIAASATRRIETDDKNLASATMFLLRNNIVNVTTLTKTDYTCDENYFVLIGRIKEQLDELNASGEVWYY